MSILDTAAETVRPANAPTYETVREHVTDPADDRKSYAVERNVTTGALMLTVTTFVADPAKDDRVKRIPLAPVARALALGVID